MASDALSMEEYLAGEQYQLGEPRGVYRRSVTFSGQVAFFAFMLLVLDLVLVVLLLAVEGLAGLSAAAPLSVVQFMIALAKILSSVRHEAVVMPFSRKVSVSVYREGLLYRRGSRTRVVRWEDIIAVSRTWRVERRKGKLKRVIHAYTCSVQAQPNLALDAGIDRVAELGKLIEQEVLRRQLPQYQEKIQAGETVAFERFSLSAQAIQYGTQSRNWSRLREIEIGPDSGYRQRGEGIHHPPDPSIQRLSRRGAAHLAERRAGTGVPRDVGRTHTAEGSTLLSLRRSEENVASRENHLGHSPGANVYRCWRTRTANPGGGRHLSKRAA